MFLKKSMYTLLAIGTLAATVAAKPEVSFTGYLDADVWADLTGNFYVNNELDLGMAVTFSEKLAAHLYATVWSANNDPTGGGVGAIPAGVGAPEKRWIDLKFDGVDITYTTGFGTFTVGDLVYQYGKFNYYFYKRLSMITTENFSRGIKFEFGTDKVSQSVMAGVADINAGTVDIQATTAIGLSDDHSLGLFYGVRGDGRLSFSEGFDGFLGAEYLGSFGEMLKAKVDVGYVNKAGADRGSIFSLLVEPTLTVGNFSTAATFFTLIDPDSANDPSAPHFKLPDELLVYVEPGYTFNDHFGVGLPLEFHGADLESDKDDAFWAVPTFYIYPTENVQWWLWGQVVAPLSDTDGAGAERSTGYGIGSELIVTF